MRISAQLLFGAKPICNTDCIKLHLLGTDKVKAGVADHNNFLAVGGKLLDYQIDNIFFFADFSVKAGTADNGKIFIYFKM